MSVHPKRKFRTGHASLEPLLSLVPRSPFWPLAEARSSPSHVGSQGQTGRRFSLGPTAAFDPSATWAGSADQLAVPADESTVAFMRLKRAVDAVDETLPDSGRVEQMLPNVAERKRRLKEQVRIRDVDGQIASECPRVHRPLVQINGDLFPVYVDRVALGTRKAPRPAFQIDRLGMCSRCS